MRYGPKKTSLLEKLKKIFGPFFVIVILFVKFFAKIKFLFLPLLKYGWMILKTGGTMLASIVAYSFLFGWWYAVGFVILILVHECGHWMAARMLGLKAGLPVFIPFMGAYVALKDVPKNAWIEAQVGIAGPLLGGLGCAGSYGLYLLTGEKIFAALAATGCTLNLLNMIPIGFLDGGRIASAISPRLWLAGFALLVATAIALYPVIDPFLLLVSIFAVPRFLSLFRKHTDEERRYLEAISSQRAIMSALYFGLAAALAVGSVFFRI